MCLHRQQVAAIVRDATPWAVSSAFLHQTSSPDERLNWHTNGKPLMLWLLERICSARRPYRPISTHFMEQGGIFWMRKISSRKQRSIFQTRWLPGNFNFLPLHGSLISLKRIRSVLLLRLVRQRNCFSSLPLMRPFTRMQFASSSGSACRFAAMSWNR